MMRAPRKVRRRGFWTLALSVCALLTFASGCRDDLDPPSPATFDPQLVSLHPGAFRTKFDGSGDVNLGVGWYGPQQSNERSPWASYSWVAQTSTIYFGAPLSPAIELAAMCAPFVYPGAPRQEMTPVLNGNLLPTVGLVPDWQQIRIPLPAKLLRRPINTLELRFAYAAVPSRVTSSPDVRDLAAVFHQISIASAGAPLDPPSAEVRAARFPRESLVVRAEGLSLPLAPDRDYLFRAAAASASGNGLRLQIRVLDRAGTIQTLWRGRAAGVGGTRLRFHTGSSASRLLLTLEGAGGPASADAAVRLDAELRQRPARTTREASRLPNVFVYLIDTLRADALGIYGSPLPLSPRIDEFARDSITYLDARSASSWTLPATTSIFSGVYPFEHGLTQLGDRLDPAAVPWIPEILSRAGYEAAAFSQWPLGRSYGLESGFGDYFLDVRLTTKSHSEAMRGLFWQYLLSRRQPDRPFFAYVHVSDPHAIYDPQGSDRWLANLSPGKLPPDFYNPHLFLAKDLGRDEAERKHLRALYDGEVRYADRQFGAFVDALKYLGLYEDSLIVLLSDHGEEFYEHGGFDHGRTLYDEVLRVPLVLKFPRSQGAGTRVRALVSTVDLAPTIASVLRIPSDSRYHGRDLPRRDAETRSGRRIFAEVKVRKSQTQIPADADLSSLLMGQIKCVRTRPRAGSPVAGPSEVYDLAKDPAERSQLSRGDPRAAECLDQLERWVLRADRPHAKRETRPLPPEEIRRLRALGYLD